MPTQPSPSSPPPKNERAARTHACAHHSTIVERGEALGLDWAATMERRRRHDWGAELKAVTNPDVTYPAYYTQPFHAYREVRREGGGGEGGSGGGGGGGGAGFSLVVALVGAMV